MQSENCETKKINFAIMRRQYGYEPIQMSSNFTDEERIDRIAKINTAFTPSQSIKMQIFFAGRSEQLDKANKTITEKGCHLIIHGDRGVGKTSLGNIIKIIMEETGKSTNMVCTRIMCDPLENFGEMWKRSLNQIIIPNTREEKGIGFEAESKNKTDYIALGELIGKDGDTKNIKASEINDLLNQLTVYSAFIFDEFDMIEDKKSKENFSYLIKMLSDTNERVTIILIGIGENIIDIIHNHKSIERCIKQIHLPRMSRNELKEIIEKGLEFIGMECDKNIKERIIDFSEGFPQYIHLLCKHSAEIAIRRGSLLIEKEDFDRSIEKSIEDIQVTIKEAYRKAVTASQENILFRQIVIACAFAKTDESNSFTARDIQKTLSEILGENKDPSQYRYHLGKLCNEERGKILRKIEGIGENRYKFTDPLLKAYVKIRAYQLGIKI